ncbi:MAG: phosphoribosylaminoimidazolesuccinocarboxamide synthase, partial [Wolbachia pipientis]|nr:phosphoribosylaminoimidazolesuccinocarboxamide synthase [Wolbachia pipientis]
MILNKIIYEGKTKSIIKTKDPFTVIQYFKDNITALNKKKHEVIEGK